MKFKLLFLSFMCFHLIKAQQPFESENKIDPKEVKSTLNIGQNGSFTIKNIEWDVINNATSNGFYAISLSNRKTNREYKLVQHTVSESDSGYRIECKVK